MDINKSTGLKTLNEGSVRVESRYLLKKRKRVYESNREKTEEARDIS